MIFDSKIFLEYHLVRAPCQLVSNKHKVNATGVTPVLS